MQRYLLRRPVTSALMLVTALGSISLTRTAVAQTAPRPRAVEQRAVAQAVSPELEKILQDWANASGRIQKLQGEHYRYVYDTVFEVEKRAEGVFYYEAPDRGRIDIEGRSISRGEKSARTNDQGVPFKLEADRGQRWICTGQEIRQIDDTQKTIEVFKIPAERQGENIMEGPLPFLFGMPPEKAKRRYELELLKSTSAQVWLAVKPRWKQDAVNWREARVILDRKHYLPTAVQLVDPSGNLETVYTFSKMEVNKQQSLFTLGRSRSPFSPDLPREYKIVRKQMTAPASRATPASRAVPRQTAELAPAAPRAAMARTVVVPAVMNFPYKDATAVLKKAGFEVKYKKGRSATNASLAYVVYEQKPQPRERIEPGSVVWLTLYDKPATASRNTRPSTSR